MDRLSDSSISKARLSKTKVVLPFSQEWNKQSLTEQKGGTTAAAMDVVEALNSGTKELLAKQRSLATKGSPLQLIQNGLTQPAEGLPAVPEVQVLLRQTRTSQRRALWFTM